MPISSHAIIPYVLQELEKVQTYKVLDVGIGSGMYGSLVWNYTKVLQGRIPYIVGVEPWEPYESPLWGCYNEIHKVPLGSFACHHKFDFIIMADVIEHMEPLEARQQVKRLKAMLSPSGVLIISTPSIFVPQEAWEGNDYEKHLSLWADADFKSMKMVPVRPARFSLMGESMLIYKFKQEVKK
jgi:predicted TPR repeat methyltransferase